MTNLINLLASILLMFAFTTPTLSSNNVLYSLNKLLPGQSLTYKDYTLTLRGDCNLVLSGPGPAILWQTHTFCPPYIYSDTFLHLTSNGELILEGACRLFPFRLTCGSWSYGVKSEEGEYALVLNDDGILKIYGKSIWSSPKPSLDCHKAPESYKTSKIPVTDSTLWSNDIAPIGTIIVKDNYKLELGWTCNMTLTDTNSNLVLWNTNTTDITRDCFVNLDRNGKLTIKYLGGANLWDNNAGSDWGQEYVLALKPEGVLTVYGPAIWSTKKSKKSFGKEANICHGDGIVVNV